MARDEKRRDPGEFYPGGKVWVKPGQSQPQGRVTWEQIEGKPQIAPLPERYRESDMKGKINEIASKFATVVVAALIGWTAVADITVQKKRKDQIYNDEQVVVDVTGSGVGVDTNAVRDIVRDTLATNGIRSVDGAARPLPKYLWLYDADDSYPEAAAEYYRSRGNGRTDGGCSSVRSGGFICRNFDYPFDDRAEFVVKMSAGHNRFASVGVAQVGTNLTEQIVTSGKPEYSHLYKWLPGATVDGINENGVACNINVVDGDPQTSGWHNDTGDLHPLAAIRWILDNATNAQHAAEYIASYIAFPPGWTQNFHYMIADADKTYIVENGSAHDVTDGVKVLTNFRLYGDPKDTTGEGQERYVALTNCANITSQWWTLTYTANGYRASDLPGITGETLTQLFNYWANNPRESHRGETFHSGTGTGNYTWWQTVHTSVYDLTNRVLRVAVQETDDWFVFQVPSSGAKIDAYTKAETDGLLAGKLDKATGAVGGNIAFFGPDGETLNDLGVPVTEFQSIREEMSIVFNAKANRAESGDDGELATLDADGNPTRSGVSADDVARLGEPVEFSEVMTGLFASKEAVIGEYGTSVRVEEGSVTAPVDVRIEDAGEVHSLRAKADRSMISATNKTFAAEVLAVQVASLSTNITAEAYIAATNACANLGIDPALIPGEGTIGTVGGFIAMLFAVVFWMRKKIFDNSGKVNDTFAGELMARPVAIQKIDERLPIPISTKSAGFTTESYKRFIVTVGGNMTVTLHTPTAKQGGGYDAEVFECRFDGASLAADASVAFDGATATTMDTNCGTVTAGKVALMSAFWNGATWDVNWKMEG